MASLGRNEILEAMSDPPDKKRRKEMDKLAKKAAAGDQAALLRLQALSGYDAKKEGGLNGVDPYADLRDDFQGQFGKANTGAATADGQNYARLLVSELTGSAVPNYLPPKDAYIGDDIGKVLKIAAPVAGALLPGVGLLGAAAIGAGGTAAGDYAAKGNINIKNALMGGGMAAAGNALLGNGLGSTGGGLPGVPGGTTAATGPGGWGGDAVMSGTGGAGGAAGAAGGSGGLLSAGGATGLLGGLKKAAPLILGGLGAVQSANQYGQANDLRQQAIDMAKQDYAGRAPLRDAFTAGALKPLPQRPDLSGMLRTTNPYQNPVPR